MADYEQNELRALMDKNKAGSLTDSERDKLIELLRKLRTDTAIPEARSSTTLLLAILVGRRRAEHKAAEQHKDAA